MEGRIWFPGNPWPEGHAVAGFDWAGRIDPDGRLFFELELRSADYDEREPTAAGDGDWRSPVVWRNYHRCTLSPGWERGLPAAEPGRPFRLTAPQTRTADPVAGIDPDVEPAFHVYLLGHDSVAGHEVTFTPTATGHDVTWTGSLALTYAGDDVFRHRFRAELRGAALRRITLPAGTAPGAARELLGQLLDSPDRFALDPSGGSFVPAPGGRTQVVDRRATP